MRVPWRARRQGPRALALAFLAAALALALPPATEPAAAMRLPAHSGRADVILAPPDVGNVSNTGATFTLDVRVEPANVTVDAAAATVRFDPALLEVVSLAAVEPLSTELLRLVDNAGGSAHYAGGRPHAPWPSTGFTLATLTFRLKAPSGGPLSVTLQSGGQYSTDAASDGRSVLETTRGTTVWSGPIPGPTASAGSGSSGGSSGGSRSSGGSTRSSTGASVPAPQPVSPIGPIGQPAPAPAVAPGIALPGPASPATAGGLPGLPGLPAGMIVGAAPIGPAFAQFYAERQGLRLLGNSLAPARLEHGLVVQYFEKGRIEEHSGEPNLLWQMQYGLLVDELMAAGARLPVGGDASTLTYATLAQLAAAAGRLPPPEGFAGGIAAQPEGAVFVPFSAGLAPEPGHVVPPYFWAYITREDLFPGGWLHDVGLPVTEPVEAMVDKGPATGRRIVVQAFQRTILTYDPLNPAGWEVERANVGTDYARAFPDHFAG